MEVDKKIGKFISCDICLQSEVETSCISDLGKAFLMLLTNTEIEVTEAYLECMKICGDCLNALKKISEFRGFVVQKWSVGREDNMNKHPECCICFVNKKKLCPIGDLQTIVDIVLMDAEVQLPQTSLMTKKCCEKCLSSLKHIFKLRNLVIGSISNQFIEEVKSVKEEEMSSNGQSVAGDSEFSDYEEEKYNFRKLPSKKLGNNLIKEDVTFSFQKQIEDVHKDDIKLQIDTTKKCDLCNNIFRNSVQYRNHMKYTHGSNEKEIFICHICEKGFASKRILSRHLNRSHNNKWQYCPFCMKKYSSPKGLPGHLVRIHKLPKLEFALPKANSRGGYLKCHICTQVCSTKNELYHHYAVEHKRREIEAKSTECEKCNKVFKTWSILNAHNKIVHEISTVDSYCEDCDIQFKNPLRLKYHRQKAVLHAGKKFKCSLCGETFRRQRFLDEHVQFVHENKCAMCPVCSKDCKSNLSKHLRYNHDLPNLKNHNEGGTCHLCGFITQTSDDFYLHFKEFHSGYRIKCDECKRFFSSRYYLNCHKFLRHKIKRDLSVNRDGDSEDKNHSVSMESKGDEPGEKPFQAFRKRFKGIRNELNTTATWHNEFICDTCHAVFKSRAKMVCHVKFCAALNVKTFKCHLCNKMYVQKSFLIQHISFEHEGKVDYLCHFCGKRCSSPAAVSRHIRYHRSMTYKKAKKEIKNDVPKVYCEECGKEFTNINNLKHHLKYTHAGKAFECPQCPKKFVYKISVKRHVQFQHENKGHPCPLCQKLFASPFSIRRHLMRIHNNPKKQIEIVPETECGKQIKKETISENSL